MAAEKIRLIVGHVSDSEARIWAQGDKYHPKAVIIVLDEDGRTMVEEIELAKKTCFTGVADFSDLKPDARHTVTLRLEGTEGRRTHYGRGGFRTAPEPAAEGGIFTFAMCSCNGRQSEPEPEPFHHLYRRSLELGSRFTLHLGDNIYFDHKPNKHKRPTLKRYCDTYNRIWAEDRSARKVLSEGANYMVMDDHDIVNNFDNGKGRWGYPAKDFLRFGLPAFDYFQNSHNPKPIREGKYYFEFAHGPARFFAMDTRLERNAEEGLMISRQQQADFEAWVRRNADEIKLVMTAVPILMRARFDRADKWSGEAFRSQRDQILQMIYQEDRRSTIFLTGDMHATYHATLAVRQPGGDTKVLHELMASPMHHWFRGRIGFDAGDWTSEDGYEMSVDFEEFSAECSAMFVTVDGSRGEVSYEGFRTATKDYRILFEDGFDV